MTSQQDFLRSAISMGRNTYGDSGSYKRLSEEEEQNKQLRPNNKNIASMEEFSYPQDNRKSNPEAMAMYPDSDARTLYPEERPVMRFENEMIGDKGTFAQKHFIPEQFEAENPIDEHTYQGELPPPLPSDPSGVTGGSLGRGRAKVNNFFRGVGRGLKEVGNVALEAAPEILEAL